MATGSDTVIINVVATTEIEFPPATGVPPVGLSWVEIYHVNGANVDTLYVHAPVDLNDDADYYGGYKEPRVLGWGEITRALSDNHGEYEASEFSWTVGDTDRLIRGWLGNEFQRYIQNRQCVIRMIDDASRRLKIRPRTLVRGIIRGYKPRGPLYFEFRAKDFVASLFGTGNDPKQIPQEAISRSVFIDCPIETVGKPVPLIFGNLTGGENDISAQPPPELTDTTGGTNGFFKDGGVWPNMGYDTLASGASPVTGVGVTAGAGGSGTLSLTWNNQYGVAVTAVDVAGFETDPEPFYFNIDYGAGRGAFLGTPVPYDTIDGTQKLTVNWTGSAGAVKYRIYWGPYYYGFKPARYMEVTHPTVTVDIVNDDDGFPTFGNYIFYYTVSALCGDGETSNAVYEGAIVLWQKRPVRVEWTAVTGAIEYHIRRRVPGHTWDRVWTVAAPTLTFTDDLADTGVTYIEGTAAITGGCPVTYVGTEPDDYGFVWFAFLVCGHQVTEIPQLFQNDSLVHPGNFGVTILVPGQAGYSTYFAGHAGTPQYKEVNGRHYTMIYGRGPQGLAASDGTQPFTCNVIGRNDDIDGNVIEDLSLIYKDFIINFGFQDSGGTHMDAPLWPTDIDGTINSQVDETSFTNLKTIHDARLGAGYTGGIAFGMNDEFITLREAIARLNQSCDCWSGFNRNSQFFVVAFNEDLAVVDAALPYTQVTDIVKASLDIDPQVDQVENVIVYSYRRNYAKVAESRDENNVIIHPATPEWDKENIEEDDPVAIANLRETRKSRPLELHGVRTAAVAGDIIARRLVWYSLPPLPVTIVTSLQGLSTELGDIVVVDHIEGLSSVGYIQRPIMIMRHITNPQNYTVKLIGLDVNRMYDYYN